jgi:HemY protein
MLAGTARRRAWRALAQLARQEGDETRAQQCERAAAAID